VSAPLVAPVQVEIKFTNRKAMRAIMRIAELSADIAEDYPWSDEAREMYVLRNVVVEVKTK
jgi:hypothetical protein